MPSATDFLPSSITLFMNLERTTSPKRGSGRTSRFSGGRRRDILHFLSLQPDPEPGTPSKYYFDGNPRPGLTAVVISGAWRRIWNGTGGGPSHPGCRGRRAGRDSARPEGRERGRRGSGRRYA